MVPPPAMLETQMNSVCTRFVRQATNKIKCPIFCVCVSSHLQYRLRTSLPSQFANYLGSRRSDGTLPNLREFTEKSNHSLLFQQNAAAHFACALPWSSSEHIGGPLQLTGTGARIRVFSAHCHSVATTVHWSGVWNVTNEARWDILREIEANCNQDNQKKNSQNSSFCLYIAIVLWFGVTSMQFVR